PAGRIERPRQGAVERHVVYLRDGAIEPVRILPCPITVVPDQLAYIHHVTLTLQNALNRLPALYLGDPVVREILRLPEEEERWLRECWGPSQERHNPVFGRLDALIDFTSPMWKQSLRFVEPNLSGIGGLHLTPTCEQIVADLVLPALRQYDPQLQLELGSDIRELLMQDILDHLEALGR